MEIKKAHILITGANRGIGRAVAEVCAENGAHLILANRSSNPELLADLQKRGAASVTEKSLDMSSAVNIDGFIAEMKDQPIDILFNNAGLATGGLVENQKMDEVYQMIQVNLTGLIHLTHGILPNMLKRGKGKVINHASVAGVMKFPAAASYDATKAGVIAFTDALKMELRGTGVTTLLLITPSVDTQMYRDIPKNQGPHLKMELPRGMKPRTYAMKITEAILEDFEVLRPTGTSGTLLWLAQHTPFIAEKLVLSQFKR